LHCSAGHRGEGDLDRRLVRAEERMKTFFDLQNLDDISEEQLVAM
jgi:hypothetical protein